jgi:hypothetical protein
VTSRMLSQQLGDGRHVGIATERAFRPRRAGSSARWKPPRRPVRRPAPDRRLRPRAAGRNDSRDRESWRSPSVRGACAAPKPAPADCSLRRPGPGQTESSSSFLLTTRSRWSSSASSTSNAREPMPARSPAHPQFTLDAADLEAHRSGRRPASDSS